MLLPTLRSIPTTKLVADYDVKHKACKPLPHVYTSPITHIRCLRITTQFMVQLKGEKIWRRVYAVWNNTQAKGLPLHYVELKKARKYLIPQRLLTFASEHEYQSHYWTHYGV